MVAVAAMALVTGVFVLVHRVFGRGHVATVYP
ncbi:hypothetical protein SAMN04488582_104545 [Mycobacterium sp. 455mf]|nr:hypothetical protein SAMN04488582_104545 [Mycobacterium sp. 455mf]